MGRKRGVLSLSLYLITFSSHLSHSSRIPALKGTTRRRTLGRKDGERREGQRKRVHFADADSVRQRETTEAVVTHRTSLPPAVKVRAENSGNLNLTAARLPLPNSKQRRRPYMPLTSLPLPLLAIALTTPMDVASSIHSNQTKMSHVCSFSFCPAPHCQSGKSLWHSSRGRT